MFKPSRPSAILWDSEIAGRVREYREETRWSQKAFAKKIGITHDQMLGIEYIRTPLRYVVAWRMMEEFGLPPAWLAFGNTFQGRQSWKYPHPNHPKLTNRALLRIVADMVERGEFEEPQPIGPGPTQSDPGAKLLDKLIGLEMKGKVWATRAPDAALDELFQRVEQAGDSFLAAQKPEAEDAARRRREALAWARERAKQRVRYEKEPWEKQKIDDIQLQCITKPVQATLKDVLTDVRNATVDRGMKKALAAELHVSPQQLTNWLNGHGSPGGAHAMELYSWVTTPARVLKTKKAASAKTDTAKTPKEPPDENQKSKSRPLKRSSTKR